MGKTDEYQLRHVGDDFFLLHMTQKGLPYEPPLLLNECGALLWEQYAAGKSEDEGARMLQEHFGISGAQARADCADFWKQLREYLR